MFRPIRRKQKEISSDAVKALLKTERRGTFAVNGDDGYPYAVPVNYIYDEEENKIYFHGSKLGHKADSVRKDDKVCFTLYGNEQVKNETWAPYMQSVVVFGRCKLIETPEENLRLVAKFAGKYYPNGTLISEEITHSGKAVQMYEITIEHMSGKEIQER